MVHSVVKSQTRLNRLSTRAQLLTYGNWQHPHTHKKYSTLSSSLEMLRSEDISEKDKSLQTSFCKLVAQVICQCPKKARAVEENEEACPRAGQRSCLMTVLKGPGSLSAAGETGPEKTAWQATPERSRKVQGKTVFCTLQTKDSTSVIQEGLNPRALGFSPASATSWLDKLGPLTTSLDLGFLRGEVWARRAEH